MFTKMTVFLFLVIHAPTGEDVVINVREIASMRTPKNPQHFAPGTGCLLFMNSGRFVSVREKCAVVIKMISELERERRKHH